MKSLETKENERLRDKVDFSKRETSGFGTLGDIGDLGI